MAEKGDSAICRAIIIQAMPTTANHIPVFSDNKRSDKVCYIVIKK